MVQVSNPARLNVSGGTKPGHGGKFHDDSRRLYREQWATFCTTSCPHPGRLCDRGPCKEFRAIFGRRKDT